MMLPLPFNPPINKIFLPEFSKNGVEVHIQRDDYLHPFISGNKWRKLKYVVEDAANKKCNHLVSFGGAYSNHLVALACAGAMLKFKTTAFVRGENVNNHMLNFCKWYGMNLIFVSREAFKNKIELYEEFAKKNELTYFIDEGGRGELGAKGCTEIIKEKTGFTHTFCAVGTGTTLAGLAINASQYSIKAEGICVLKGAEGINQDVENIAGFNVPIHHNFHAGGYAKTTPELLSFAKHFAQNTGILLDQIYTAKLMFGILQLINQNYFEPNSKILAIHTGGLLGMLTAIE
ncbi:MAG: pyridoxal-phosphate dependent enzyme [Bacteroidia bacterium]|nr:pyridoxal-phosphate dependent enzyme [Bacteroidia bacterium]